MIATQIGKVLNDLPLWVIGPLLALLLMGAHEVGIQIRLRMRARRLRAGEDPDHGEDAVGGHLGAVLGLMALLLGFSFAVTVDRFRTLRTLVSEEAWAVGADYRRILAAPEPQRTKLADGLLEYLTDREAFSRSGESGLAGAEVATHEHAQRLWIHGLSIAHERDTPEVQAVLGSTDAMLKAAFARETALAAHEPAPLAGAMMLYVFIATIFVGYAAKTDRRLLPASTAQLALLALVICLILDLDRAHSGTIRVDQAPMFRTIEHIRAFEAQRRAAPPAPWLAPAAPVR